MFERIKKRYRVLRPSDVGKILNVIFPQLKRKLPVYRWITKGRADGRFLGRAPRVGVFLRDLNKKKNTDFGPACLLPKDARVDVKLEMIARAARYALKAKLERRKRLGLTRLPNKAVQRTRARAARAADL